MGSLCRLGSDTFTVLPPPSLPISTHSLVAQLAASRFSLLAQRMEDPTFQAKLSAADREAVRRTQAKLGAMAEFLVAPTH